MSNLNSFIATPSKFAFFLIFETKVISKFFDFYIERYLHSCFPLFVAIQLDFFEKFWNQPLVVRVDSVNPAMLFGKQSHCGNKIMVCSCNSADTRYF